MSRANEKELSFEATFSISKAPGVRHQKYIPVVMYDRIGKNLFKALILLYGQAAPMGKSVFRNIVDCYQNVISKVLKKLPLVESLSN